MPKWRSFIGILLFFTFAFYAKPCFARIYINEVSPNEEWVELYSTTVNELLEGYVLHFDDDLTLASQKKTLTGAMDGQYKLIYSEGSYLANSGGDTVVLGGTEGDVLGYGDEGSIGLPGAGKSVGRSPDGSINIVIFESPSPNSPNPTPAPTLAPTPTDTPIPEPTNSPSPIPTPSGEPTLTPSPTNTPTPIPTNSLTPTKTPTPTNTPKPPTNTPTQKPTNTPTPTLKPTATPTKVATPTITVSPIDPDAEASDSVSENVAELLGSTSTPTGNILGEVKEAGKSGEKDEGAKNRLIAAGFIGTGLLLVLGAAIGGRKKNNNFDTIEDDDEEV